MTNGELWNPRSQNRDLGHPEISLKYARVTGNLLFGLAFRGGSVAEAESLGKFLLFLVDIEQAGMFGHNLSMDGLQGKVGRSD